MTHLLEEVEDDFLVRTREIKDTVGFEPSVEEEEAFVRKALKVGVVVTPNDVLLYPLRVIMENHIAGALDTCSLLTKNIYGIYVYLIGRKKYSEPRGKQLIDTLYEIDDRVTKDGATIYVQESFTAMDKEYLFAAIDRLHGTKIVRNKITYNGHALYPISKFPSFYKEKAIYPTLDNVSPNILKLVKKHKHPIYITKEFDLVTGDWILEQPLEDLGLSPEEAKSLNFTLDESTKLKVIKLL